MIDSLSITGLEYGTTFLAIQLFADFEIEYLSLPESYDNNFVIPCLTTLWSIINTKKISGRCLFLASDTNWKLHLKQTYFHFTFPTVQQLMAVNLINRHFLARCTRIVMEEFNTCLKRSRFGEKIKDFTLISNACHQNIEVKILIFVSSFRCSRKIRDYSS